MKTFSFQMNKQIIPSFVFVGNCKYKIYFFEISNAVLYIFSRHHILLWILKYLPFGAYLNYDSLQLFPKSFGEKYFSIINELEVCKRHTSKSYLCKEVLARQNYHQLIKHSLISYTLYNSRTIETIFIFLVFLNLFPAGKKL